MVYKLYIIPNFLEYWRETGENSSGETIVSPAIVDSLVLVFPRGIDSREFEYPAAAGNNVWRGIRGRIYIYI